MDLNANPLKMINDLVNKFNRINEKYQKSRYLTHKFKSSVERMNETMIKQREILKVKKRQEQEWETTKKNFNKSLSRIRESFVRGKEVLNDDLQEMEIKVQEIK